MEMTKEVKPFIRTFVNIVYMFVWVCVCVCVRL